MISKKAQLASGMGWFVTIIIVFFMLLVFFVFSGVIAVDNFRQGKFIKVEVEKYPGMSYESFRGMVRVLEERTPEEFTKDYGGRVETYEIEGGGQLMRDYVQVMDYNDARVSSDFFNSLFEIEECQDYFFFIGKTAFIREIGGEKLGSGFSTLQIDPQPGEQMMGFGFVEDDLIEIYLDETQIKYAEKNTC